MLTEFRFLHEPHEPVLPVHRPGYCGNAFQGTNRPLALSVPLFCRFVDRVRLSYLPLNFIGRFA